MTKFLKYQDVTSGINFKFAEIDGEVYFRIRDILVYYGANLNMSTYLHRKLEAMNHSSEDSLKKIAFYNLGRPQLFMSITYLFAYSDEIANETKWIKLDEHLSEIFENVQELATLYTVADYEKDLEGRGEASRERAETAEEVKAEILRKSSVKNETVDKPEEKDIEERFIPRGEALKIADEKDLASYDSIELHALNMLRRTINLREENEALRKENKELKDKIEKVQEVFKMLNVNPLGGQ